VKTKKITRRMPSSAMLRRVALVITDGSEERSASFVRMTRIGELGTTLALTSNRHTMLGFLRSVRRLLVRASVVPSSSILVILMKEALSSFETSVLSRATRHSIPKDAMLQLNLSATAAPILFFLHFFPSSFLSLFPSRFSLNSLSGLSLFYVFSFPIYASAVDIYLFIHMLFKINF
jgi:hypothetical protein